MSLRFQVMHGLIVMKRFSRVTRNGFISGGATLVSSLLFLRLMGAAVAGLLSGETVL
jgi:hypothetical protein